MPVLKILSVELVLFLGEVLVSVRGLEVQGAGLGVELGGLVVETGGGGTVKDLEHHLLAV